jgi:hypothetical protein
LLGAPTPFTMTLLSMTRVDAEPNCSELLSTKLMVNDALGFVTIRSCSIIGMFGAAAMVAPARWMLAVPASCVIVPTVFCACAAGALAVIAIIASTTNDHTRNQLKLLPFFIYVTPLQTLNPYAPRIGGPV